MRKYISYTIGFLLLFKASIVCSQEQVTELSVKFRVNKTYLDSTYMDNPTNLAEIKAYIHSLKQDSTIQIVEVAFCGAASPEGSYQVNRRLSQARLTALEKLVRQQIDLPDSIITYNDSYIPWHYLREEVASSDIPYKDEILAILDADSSLVDYHHVNTHIDRRVVLLKELQGGKAWTLIFNRYFKQMRNATAVFVTYKKKTNQEVQISQIPDTIPQNTGALLILQDTVKKEIISEPEREVLLHVKTNAVGLAMGIANLGVEADITRHLTFSLPVYYSAWNYFTSTIKFRTFAIQPELRYWLSPENDGWFAGAHFELAYYNFAFDGDYRYQDHNRTTPAIGGGLTLGYRMPLSKDKRFRVEFAIGGGAYKLHYDVFHNTPDTKDGLMTESIKKTYWGLDNAAVTFSYAFDLNQKGGKR